MSKHQEPRPLIGLLSGMAAGLVASAAMAAFQAKAAPLVEDEQKGDPATVKAADKAGEVVLGKDVPDPWREQAGQIVHYVVGAALGAVYGVVAEYRPEATAGFGTAYGALTAMVLDEGAVPAAGLGAKPGETSAPVHLYSVAGHMIYGMVLEGARGLLAGKRD